MLLWKRISSFFPLPFFQIRKGNGRARALGVGEFILDQHTEELIRKIDRQIRESPSKRAQRFAGYAISKGLSYHTMNQGFLKVFGRSFRNHHRYLRIQKAKELLLAIGIEQTVIVMKYSHVMVLVRDFLKIENMTPEEYIESQTPPE